MSRSTTFAFTHHPDGSARAWTSEAHGFSVILFGTAMTRVADAVIDELSALPTTFAPDTSASHPPAVLAVAGVFERAHRDLWNRNQAGRTTDDLGIGACIVHEEQVFFLQVGPSRLVHLRPNGAARDIAGKGDDGAMLGLAARSGIRVHRVSFAAGCRLVVFVGDAATEVGARAMASAVGELDAEAASHTALKLVGPNGMGAITIVERAAEASPAETVTGAALPSASPPTSPPPPPPAPAAIESPESGSPGIESPAPATSEEPTVEPGAGFDFQSDVVQELSDFMSELQRDPDAARAAALDKPVVETPPAPAPKRSSLGRNQSGLFEIDPDEAPPRRAAPQPKWASSPYDAARDAVDDATNETIDDATNETIDDATNETIDQAASDAADHTANEAIDGAAREVTTDSAGDAVTEAEFPVDPLEASGIDEPLRGATTISDAEPEPSSGSTTPDDPPSDHERAVAAALARVEEAEDEGRRWMKWVLVALVAIAIPAFVLGIRPDLWDRLVDRVSTVSVPALTAPGVPADVGMSTAGEAAPPSPVPAAPASDPTVLTPTPPAEDAAVEDGGATDEAVPSTPDLTVPVEDDQSVLIDVLGPAGGKIRVDGHLLAVTTPATDVKVRSGARLIEVDHGRLGRWSSLLDVGEGLDAIDTAPTGTITFAQMTAPGVVRIDGKVIGEPLPSRLDVATGTHELTLEADGEIIVTRTIFVANDVPTFIDLPSAPRGDALLVIESREFQGDGFLESEGDSVWIDRKFVGRTPLEFTVDAGIHSVRVTDGERERHTQVLRLEPSTIRVVRADFGVSSRVDLNPREPENLSPGDPALLAVAVNDAVHPAVESMTCEFRVAPDAGFRSIPMNRLEEGGALWVALVSGTETAAGHLEYYMSALDADGVQVVSEIHQVSFAGDTASM